MPLRDFIGRCAANYPTQTAYVSGDARRTWAEVHARTDKLAGAMQALGIKKGDVVGILSHNRIEIAENWLASLKAGTVRTGINWRYSAREALHTIRDSDARAVVVQSECVELIAPYLDELRSEGRMFIGFGAGHDLEYDYEELIAQDNPATYPALTPNDGALIGYTSGSTGLPKGVLLTQKNVSESTIHLSLGWNYTFDDVRLYCTNPAGANIFMTCMNIVTGMTTVIEDYDIDTFFDLVTRHRVTQVTLVPTMLRRTIEAMRTRHHDVSSLKQILYGSMAASPALIRSAYETIGCHFGQIYGSSETCGPVTMLRNADHQRALNGESELLSSVGRALPHAQLSVRDEDGRPVPVGEMGTVWLGGDSVMACYINRPEETREALAGPWLRSGDTGKLDENGYLYLGDRKKNMIISGGMNIYPLGIENALEEYAAISEAVVVGVLHPEWGEAVVAMVTLKSGCTAMVGEIIAHCRTHMPRWEIPKHIAIVPALPRGFTDKIDKQAVLRQLIELDQIPWTMPA